MLRAALAIVTAHYPELLHRVVFYEVAAATFQYYNNNNYNNNNNNNNNIRP